MDSIYTTKRPTIAAKVASPLVSSSAVITINPQSNFFMKLRHIARYY